MTITGCITLYNITFGSGSSDMDALIHRVEFWLGIGLTIAGMFGFLPDQPTRDPQERTREIDIPKDVYIPQISLVGRSESADEEGDSLPVAGSNSEYRDSPVLRVRTASLPSNNEYQDPGSTLRQDGSGYNG
jgi:hypothetical protein